MNAPVDIRNGHYMHTSNGKKYWPLDPRPSEVFVEVIAHHLATRARYNGATQHPKFKERLLYSVAEHSVLVALYAALRGASEDEIRACLFHDGAESFNGDLIRPLKHDPLFAGPFKIVEALNEAAIAKRFGFDYPYPPIVKIADEAVTAAEVQQVVPRDPNEEWDSGRLHDNSNVAPFEIQMFSPYEAKLFFLRAYELLEEGCFPRTAESIDAFLTWFSK